MCNAPKLYGLAASLAFFVSVSCSPGELQRSLVPREVELDVSEQRHALLQWVDSIGIGAGRAISPIPARQTVGILDGSDATILALIDDRLAKIGHKGPGPGELERPVMFATQGEMVAVLDRSGKLVWIDLASGSAAGQVNVIVSSLYPSLAILDDGSVVVPTVRHAGFIGERLRQDGSSERWGAAPDIQYNEGFTLNMAARVGDDIAVMDNFSGRLLIYTPEGIRKDSLSLPGAIRDRIDAGLEEMRVAGTGVLGNPYVIGMHAFDDDRLFLRLTPLESLPIGLVVHPGRGVEEVIHASRLREDDQFILRRARSVILFDETILALTRNEVYSFPVVE